ncbi:hypothetical protein ISI31_000696 [Salmonella enterica]|nr:hypothetical protein [Salmonella enterica]
MMWLFYFVFFSYVGCVTLHPVFFGGAMSKPVLILLGIAIIPALIIIVMAAIDEYLHGHDS